MSATEEQTSGASLAPPEPAGFGVVLASVGEPFLFVGRELAAMAHVLWLTVFYAFRRPVRWSEVWRQAFEIGNRSLVFIAVVLGFLGMILIYQSGFQAQRIVGDLQLLGALYLQMLFREFGPTITALMLATRVGTGIAAEIGSMVVTEQVDALRMNNADPVHYLVVPRFIASVLMTLVLSTLAIVVSFISGMWTAKMMFGVNPGTFYNTSFIIWGDLIIFGMKSLAYGIAVPIIAAEAGLSAFGGSEGVGWATTKSVVNASLAITFLDFLLSGFGYVFLFS
ncbi:MAG: ABC transporter permease [Myxococcales bacterium]|nr:ABC transporter permease [Myxococcales bacterium]MCB9530493.1 ABC transporter permease [Myxococcales bacterium]MCB9533445.1 ABC transporter permease [Myxococcales bacterium]